MTNSRSRNTKSKGNFPPDMRGMMYAATGGYCHMPGCHEQATECHHIMPNTKENRALFPIFICSPFNCMPLCNGCHMNKPLPRKPSERLIQLYEAYLRSLSCT